jgi:hypothetical protein
MFRPHNLTLVPAALALAGGAPLLALDSYIVGPRAEGMGGTGVASANDHTAQYYNPALFGFFGSTTGPDNQGLAGKSWGVGIDANAGVRIHGNLLELAETLADTDVERLSNDGIQTEADLHQVLLAARALSEVGAKGNAVSADASAGVTVRIGHAALGARIYGQAATLVSNTDLLNVALDVAGVALANRINGTGSPSDGNVALFSTAQRDSLYSSFGGTGAYDPASAAGQAVQRIDFQLRDSGFNASQVDTTFTVIQNAAAGSGQSFENNDTVLRLRAFALAEVPLSYGWAIDDTWSVGGSLKLMMGRVYGTELSIFEENAPTQFNASVDNYQTTTTWGIDLAVAGRFQWFQVGAVGRNLNSPEFAGFTNSFGVKVADVRVDPQVAVGVAFIPYQWLTVALDADLLAAASSFPGYDTQRIGAGLEVNPWNALALRAGVYQNIAESDIGPVITLGAGVNLWAVRIDLGLAASTHLTQLRDHEVPDELRLSLGLMADF